MQPQATYTDVVRDSNGVETEVTTSWRDYEDSGRHWVELESAERDWWIDLVQSIHETRVELEKLEGKYRREAQEVIDSAPRYEPEAIPAVNTQGLEWAARLRHADDCMAAVGAGLEVCVEALGRPGLTSAISDSIEYEVRRVLSGLTASAILDYVDDFDKTTEFPTTTLTDVINDRMEWRSEWPGNIAVFVCEL